MSKLKGPQQRLFSVDERWGKRQHRKAEDFKTITTLIQPNTTEKKCVPPEQSGFPPSPQTPHRSGVRGGWAEQQNLHPCWQVTRHLPHAIGGNNVWSPHKATASQPSPSPLGWSQWRLSGESAHSPQWKWGSHSCHSVTGVRVRSSQETPLTSQQTWYQQKSAGQLELPPQPGSDEKPLCSGLNRSRAQNLGCHYHLAVLMLHPISLLGLCQTKPAKTQSLNKIQHLIIRCPKYPGFNQNSHVMPRA